MTNLIPVTIGKRAIEKKHPFLTEFVFIMNSCFVHNNAPLVENVQVIARKTRFAKSEWYSVNSRCTSSSLTYTSKLHQVFRKILQVYVSHRQIVETSRPPSCLQIIGLEHKYTLTCPQCTAAGSQKSFCLPGPLRRLICEPV